MDDSTNHQLQAFGALASALLAEQVVNSALSQIILFRLGVSQEDIDKIYARARAESEERRRKVMRSFAEGIVPKPSDADWWKRFDG